MEYNEVEPLVRRTVYDILRELIDDKECPKCKAFVTMINVTVEPAPRNAETLNEAEVERYWKCLKCGGIFEEKLVAKQ